MKRISALALCGVVVFSLWAWGGFNNFNLHTSFTHTGVTGDSDSIVVETIPLLNTQHYGNRIIGHVIFDSITKHEPAAYGNQDTVIMKLISQLGSQIYTLDSSLVVLTAAQTGTLFVSEGRDTLYGENVYLVISVNDTLEAGPTTDTTYTFPIRIHLGHGFQD